MIRLTLNAQSDPEIHLFNKSVIFLGADANYVDLVLHDAGIQPLHLKIIEQNDFPILVNFANDPFVSVNGHPFGKKLLNTGDVILVHQTTILFEKITSVEQPQETLIVQQESLQETLAATPPLNSFTLPFEKEIESLNEESFSGQSLEKYLNDLSSDPPSPSTDRISLKDDYLRDMDDEEHQFPEYANNLNSQNLPYRPWKWIALFILIVFSLIGVIGTVLFFRVTDKTIAQETKAAQGVADLAIALTHAQLNHLKPSNENWSDVEFLKQKLKDILLDAPSYASHIDPKGQFNCCPYSLRIYTSSDLSHFLLIAQPAPNLLYWLIPQSIIVVDSSLMDLRSLKDVRDLNRLLAIGDPLDSLNRNEITNLVKQGELIPLSDLEHLDFSPPKNLALIHPGAENLIYNAPRYHRLGHRIVQKAISLSTSKSSSREVAELKEEVEKFSCLNHLILYCDRGEESALLTRQGLRMFAPSDKILYGYVNVNTEGQINQVFLLDENNINESHPHHSNREELIAFDNPNLNVQKEQNLSFDRNHPIFLKLQSLEIAREKELKSLISALFTLVNQELQVPKVQFQVDFQNLSHSYLKTNAKHKKAIKETVDALFKQYANLPIQQFLAMINELHLNHLIQQDEHHKLSVKEENCQRNMTDLIAHLENSQSLAELGHIVHIAISWINFDYIKDPQELMRYQNQLRNHLLEQLKGYLLTPKKAALVKAEDREVLQDLLNQERLINAEERDYFIQEFEELISSTTQAVKHSQ